MPIITPGGVPSAAAALPNSWILLTGDARTTSGTLALSESAHAGSDLALNVDTFHVDILTPGAYVVYAQVPVSGDATGAGTVEVQIAGSLFNDAWGGAENPNLVRVKVIPASFVAILTLTLPPIAATVARQVQFSTQITTTAGAITVGGNGNNDNYIIQRIF